MIFYPHNFFTEKNGITTRYLQLLKYFKSRNIQVDILTLKHFKSSWEHFPADKWGLVNELYFYDFSQGSRFLDFKNRKSNPLARLKRYLPFFPAYTHLPNFAYPDMKKQVSEILQKKRYDIFLISYVYWADLIPNPYLDHGLTMLDLSDFITLNRFDCCNGDMAIGSMIEEEIRRVNLFQKVLCISQEEKWFFSQFATRPTYYYVPFFMDSPPPNDHSANPPSNTLLFVGSDNTHNQKGMAWFMKEVFPLLDNSVSIKTVGAISKHMGTHPRIHTVQAIDDLSDIYMTSKIAICPLLGGTGMKSKVVEALSYGLPVVSTSKGLSGLPVKAGCGCQIADSPQQFAHYIHRLNSDPLYFHQEKQNATQFFRENFESAIVYRQLDEIFVPGR